MSHLTHYFLGLFTFACCLASYGYSQDQSPRSATITAKAVTELATALIAAKTEEELTVLLAANKDLQTPALVQALLSQGNQLRGRLGFFSQDVAPQALAIFQLSYRLAEQMEDKANAATALSRIGDVHRHRGNLNAALEHYRKCLTLREALGDKAGIADVLLFMGLSYSQRQDFALALEHFQKSLAVLKRLDDKRAMAEVENHIGEAYRFQSKYGLALEAYQKALVLRESLADKAGMAETLFNIGFLYNLQGEMALASSYFQRSLALYESPGNKTSIVNALFQVGRIFMEQRNYGASLVYLQRSLVLYEAAGNKLMTANALEWICGVQGMQGNFLAAVESCRKSLVLRESLVDRRGISGTLFLMGRASRHVEDFPGALEYFQQSLKLREPNDRVEAANTIYEIAETYKAQGNQAAALEYFQKNLKLREALDDKFAMVRTLHDIGNILVQQGEYPQAQQAAEQATALARQSGSNESLWRARVLTGEVYRALNQPVQAQAAFEGAVSAIEAMRAQLNDEHARIRYLETRLIPWHRLVELLVAQNRIGAALNYTEQAKARGHLDIIHGGHAVLTEEMTPLEREQESKIKGKLAAANVQITRESNRPKPDERVLAESRAQQQTARAEREAFYASLYSAHREMRALRGKAEPLKFEEAAHLLPDSTSALLNYLVTDEKTFLFVLTRAGRTAQPTVRGYTINIKAQELNERAAALRRSLANRSYDFQTVARQLYDLLIKPAAAQLQGKKLLTISPDAGLWELPFQVLQPAPGQYLIQKQAIAYAPSLSVLRETLKLRSRGSSVKSGRASLLAIGNPSLGKETIARAKSVLMDENLDPLPEAEDQVMKLKQIYGPAQSKVLIGHEALEESFKTEAPKYRILHLATHGLLNNASPIYSQLLLSQTGNEGEDGLLEAWEILRMNLNADLAVLSACETARGRWGAGEGIVGIAGALFVAGCPTVVVSQWKVEAASTTELIVEFHRQLKTRMKSKPARLGTAQALRAAALKMLRGGQYRHPFWWAGFVVIGDGF